MNLPTELKAIARPQDLPLTCSDEELVEAVKVWLIGGDNAVLSNLLHIPEHAVPQWTKSRGWAEIVEFYKPELTGVLSGQLFRVGSMCLDQIEERIRLGDPRLGPDGEVLGYKPIRAKELAQISTQMFETKAKLEGKTGGLNKQQVYELAEIMTALRNEAAKDISGESERV